MPEVRPHAQVPRQDHGGSLSGRHRHLKPGMSLGCKEAFWLGSFRARDMEDDKR